MVKLKARDKILLKNDIKAGLPSKTIMDKFHISSATFYRYTKLVEAEMNSEIVLKKPVKIVKSKEETVVGDFPNDETKLNNSENVSESPGEDFSINDLHKTSNPVLQQVELKIDENKDYCGNCYNNKVLTEINLGMIKCPVCGAELLW